MIKTILFVGMGSFVGGSLRFLAGKLTSSLGINYHGFPISTFLVNVIGCFAIGLFYAWFDKNATLSENMKAFLTVGLCGGFTTFSTFMNDNLGLVKADNFVMMAFYLAASLFIGFGFLVLGYKCA